MDEPQTSVFVSSIPKSMSEDRLLEVLQRGGRVVSLRVMVSQKRPGSAPTDTMVAFCDYADSAAAKAAVAVANGFVCPDGTRLAAKLSEKKRPREEQEQAENEFVHGSSLAGPGDPIQVALSQIPPSELYEAVEQLRVLVLERPAAARQLLSTNPQLRYAVALVLQHAGRVPLQLPRVAVLGEAQVAQLQPSADSVTTAPAVASTGQSMRDAAIAAISELSELELHRMLALTDDDLRQHDPVTADYLRSLQAELKKLL
jgi:hypothetical protein